MLVFRTQLPLKDSITESHCLDLFLKWIVQNPHYPIDQIPWDPASGCDLDFRKKHIRIAIRHYQDSLIQLAACRFQNRAGNVLWQSDCVFVSSNGKNSVLIEQRRICSHSADHPYRIRKPHIVRMLVENGFCRDDNGIPITDTPLDADGRHYCACAQILSGRLICALPSVLISCDELGNHAVSCRYIAAQLGGMAHIFAQKNAETTDRLQADIAAEPVSGGKIGVYLPGGTLCKCYSPSEFADDRVLSWQIINDIRTGLTETSQIYGWEQVIALISSTEGTDQPSAVAVQ